LCRQCRPVCCARRDAVLYQYSQGTSTRRIRSFEYFSFDFVILSNTLLIARTRRAPTHRPACAGGLPAASGSVVVDVVSVLQTVVHSRVLEQGDEPVSSLCERREHANMRVTRTCWRVHQSGRGGRGGAHGRRLPRPPRCATACAAWCESHRVSVFSVQCQY